MKQAPRVAGQAVYLSSVTDPYLPAERSLRLTRGILEVLLPHQPRLLVQTRGPLVVRDIDLLRQLHAMRINVSIPTDSEEVRKTFEPKAPPLEDRWAALAKLRAAGLPVGICLTPLLPLADLSAFTQRLAAFAANQAAKNAQKNCKARRPTAICHLVTDSPGRHPRHPSTEPEPINQPTRAPARAG